MIAKITRLTLRFAVGGFQRIRRSIWFFSRPRTFGAHALAFTPEGRIVLVRLRYAPGWRLPGGGRKANEDPRDAALRELREEIGMISHASVEMATELDDNPDFRRDTSSLLIVRHVEYRPRWSLEIEEVMEAHLDDLPPDTSERTLRWIEALRPMLK